MPRGPCRVDPLFVSVVRRAAFSPRSRCADVPRADCLELVWLWARLERPAFGFGALDFTSFRLIDFLAFGAAFFPRIFDFPDDFFFFPNVSGFTMMGVYHSAPDRTT